MSDAQQILESIFGYASFREPQRDIVQTVIDGGDALVLMPTGGGKSLCYQAPAMANDGMAVVVSPLHHKLLPHKPKAISKFPVRHF